MCKLAMGEASLRSSQGSGVSAKPSGDNFCSYKVVPVLAS